MIKRLSSPKRKRDFFFFLEDIGDRGRGLGMGRKKGGRERNTGDCFRQRYKRGT